MAYCPNCAFELPANAERCGQCNVMFTDAEGWKPLARPPESEKSTSLAPHPSTWLAGLLGVLYAVLIGALESSHATPDAILGKVALVVGPPVLVSFATTLITGRMTLGPATGFAAGAGIAAMFALPIVGLIFGPVVFVAMFVCGAIAVPLSALAATIWR